MVGMTGFEPAASRSRTVRSSQAELHPEKIPIGGEWSTKLSHAPK